MKDPQIINSIMANKVEIQVIEATSVYQDSCKMELIMMHIKQKKVRLPYYL